jgi:tetratricopeptide (TPR) repeat protein
MQLLLREIQETFEDFLSDETEQFMVLNCTNESAGWVLKSLETIDNQPENYDVFLNFGHEFDNPKDYFGLIVDQIKDQIAFINLELKKTDKATYKALPKILDDKEYRPEQRLWVVFQHLRKQIEEQRQINWLLFPMQISDEKVYFETVDYLIRKLKESDLGGINLIVRETESLLFKEKFTDKTDDKEFNFYSPTVDMDSIAESMERQAKSKDASPDEKAQAQMLLAGIDVANKDFEQAYKRNSIALKHFASTDQKMQQSVTLNNMGDLFYFQQNFVEAEKHYEKAIKIALAEKSQPLMIYQCFNLGNSLYMQERLDEAFVYYDSSKKLAEVNQVLIHEIKAIEMMGVAKHDQGFVSEAIEIWEKGANKCRQNKYKLGIVPLLERLLPVYKSSDDKPTNKKSTMCERELRDTKTFLKAINPNLVS